MAVTGSEDVAFDVAAAETLESQCRSAACQVENLHSSRTGWVATAKTDFSGYFSTVFSDNADIETTDASNLAACLRGVADAVRFLINRAAEENAQRKKARDWDERRAHKNVLHKAWDDAWNLDQRPTSTLGPPPSQEPAAPTLTERSNPSQGTTASGYTTSSARPDNLRSFATSSQGANNDLTTTLGNLKSYDATFQAGCKWGTLNAASVWAGFQSYIDANNNDVTWANTIADAFESVGGGDELCTVYDAALGEALERAGVTAVRQTLTIDPAQVQGMPPTSGFCDDPVNTATGGFVEAETDLVFDGGAAALAWPRCYNATDRSTGALGPGWSSPADSRLSWGPDGEGRWRTDDGRLIVFPRLGEGWDRSVGASWWLERLPRDPDGASAPAFEVTDSSGGSWLFDAAGRTVRTSRGSGTAVTLVWDGDRLVRLSHERGRSLEVDWDEAAGRIAAVRTDDGRAVRYDYDGAGRLVRARGADRGERRYGWDEDSGLLARITDADGVVEVDNTYDEHGRVASQRSPFGRVSRYAYMPGLITLVCDENGDRANTWISDEHGRLIGVIDSDGKRQSTSWDRWGNLVMTRDRDGGVSVSQYDERGRRTASLTPRGLRTDWQWDDADRLTRLTVTAPGPAGGPEGSGSAEDGTAGPAEATTLFAYEGENRNPSTITDPMGGVTTMVWRDNLLTEITDPEGVRLRLEYDAHGDLSALIDADGGRAVLEHDAAGRVTRIVTPAGSATSFEYDDAGRPVARRDPDGAVRRWEYSPAGRLTASVDPLGARTTIEYDASGTERASVDPLGSRLESRRDDLGNLTGVRLPDGREWTFIHDALSRLRRVTDPSGATSTTDYDALGRVVETRDPLGATASLSWDRDGSLSVQAAGEFARLGVDALGRPLRLVHRDADRPATDRPAAGGSGAAGIGRPEPPDTGAGTTGSGADGQNGADETSEVVVRDLCGRVVETLDAEGGLTRLVRDRAGRIVEATDPDGRTTRYGWDACGRPAWQEAPDGGRTDYTYDADWRVVAVETPDGRTEAAYDECGRMIRLTRPGWGTSSWSYDRAGRLREERSAAWGRIRYAHDAAGRLTAVTNALGGTTRFDYDQCGRLVSTTDPLGRTTSRTYTASDKVETLTDPLGAVTRAGYDAAGRQTWQTDPAGGRLDFSYDEAGRPTLTVGTDADGEVVLRSRESWRGRTLRAQGPDGADEIDVDRLGRPLAHRRDGRTVSTWAWSAGGELLERTGPGAERTILTRDEDAGTVSLDGTAFGRVTLTRDRAGRLTSMSGPGLRQTWQWDAAGRMILHEAVVDGASTRSEVVYDDAGRPLRVTGPEGTTSYSYDEAGQLVGVEGPRGRETLTWDAAGALRERRRVSETGEEEVERFSYDGAGRLTARVRDGGATTYTYDAAGRRTGQEGPEGRCRYTWSPAGLLMGVSVQGPGRDQERTPESSGGGGESEGGEPVTWRIERDALGLPVRIGGTEVTWDVATAVPSISSFDGAAVTELPGALAVKGVLHPAGWRTARAGGSANPWAIPAAVVGGEGEGRPAVGGPGAGMGADAAGDPAGGPVLTASGTLGVGGLELLGARAYDPGTAAFLTPDPLTHAPTAPWTANPYSYAANSPLSFSDPLGLKPLSDAELQAYTDAHTGWNRVGQWISDNKDYIAGAAMLVGGGILTACGVEPFGPMLIGAGVDAIIQRATTGHTSYGQVALSGMLGMVGEVAGAARAAQLGWHGLRATMLVGASSGAASGAGASGYAYMTGPGPHTVGGFVGNTLAGGLGGGLTGGAISAVGHGLARGISNITGHNVMADPTILSGHGGIPRGDTATFTVPKGTYIRFYCPHGEGISDGLGNAIETGVRRWPFRNAQPRPYEIVSPGGVVPDYFLIPPRGLNIKGNPITVSEWTRLSELVSVHGNGVYDWAACRREL